MESIRLRGAKQNNLKNVDVDIPLGKLTVVTGLSGAGKSSLVFDTLHAEGQRRYVETFSSYTRQFMDLLDAPDVKEVENIRPSIAIQQSNSVRTSRSTVGTMTELCDFFKVWFAQSAQLFDPADGKVIVDNHPQQIFEDVIKAKEGTRFLVCFTIPLSDKKGMWEMARDGLSSQGYTRVWMEGGPVRIDSLDSEKMDGQSSLTIIQDRVVLSQKNRARFLEAIRVAFQFGHNRMQLIAEDGSVDESFTSGMVSPVTGKKYRSAIPALFSFNSPIGACPTCRGFGRVIEIDERLIIPNKKLSLEDGAIRPFQGKVYSESLRDLARVARKHKIRMNVPWEELSEREIDFVMNGEEDYQENGGSQGQWYGVWRFFKWLESNIYKMHVRVFLSKYRSYVTCPNCKGARLQEESLLWKWKEYRLPDLYQLPINQLFALLEAEKTSDEGEGVQKGSDLLGAILLRLRYLNEVGLGYLTLDRTSRTLSGGETQRVSLTSCLGTSLVDTLFVLDEPSIGLHARDMDQLIQLLKNLAKAGNTVVVVEHDEAVMRAADHLIEVGPQPGSEGGTITFAGKYREMLHSSESITGGYLSGRETVGVLDSLIATPKIPKRAPHLHVSNASKHNIKNLSLSVPLNKWVCLSGVSGSGKSTFLNQILFQGVQSSMGQSVEDPAQMDEVEFDQPIQTVKLVDQSPLTKTPRSNPALYVEVWNPIRELFAKTEEARSAGIVASDFSFNSGQGRCDHCQGLGYEKIEMQFLPDVYVTCPVCDGKRFKPEVLAISWKGHSIDDILSMTIHRAVEAFAGYAKIASALNTLEEVGLGYLTVGQPLNTLSGGESQRLKLVKYLSRFQKTEEHALLLLDEPTTGLHRHDVKKLLHVFRQLVEAGHSLVVIEHQMDVLAHADWIIEMGPGAGQDGGKVVAQCTPYQLSQKNTETARYLEEYFSSQEIEIAAEPASTYHLNEKFQPQSLQVVGAREHNLKNIDVEIPHNSFTVVTGVSGSGKSTLAFDIIFAEGQRRFMESMSAYTRQFVEQLSKPDIDELSGIPPTVAIEQRVNRGTKKSTVGTITEVAQYLRLLYARIGVQYNPRTNHAVVTQSASEITTQILDRLAQHPDSIYRICAPLFRSKKGHHEPIANWASDRGYEYLRCDGEFVHLDNFVRLDRYKEHDFDLVVDELDVTNTKINAKTIISTALRLGKGICYLCDRETEESIYFSMHRVDPISGESFAELDPKDFSWNSPRGWCPTCRGYGEVYDWMNDHEDYAVTVDDDEHGAECPDCHGARVKEESRHVYLFDQEGARYSFPDLLAAPPSRLLELMKNLRLNTREKKIAKDLIKQILSRIQFMDTVGLSYLSMNRSTSTLSGGESQRIRLSAQLGSNLCGVLYVLDEPSIGLHAVDNQRLIQSLLDLKNRGNSVLVVEHDEEMMQQADHIIDIGPDAGEHGGEILAQGTLATIKRNKLSHTGAYLKKGIVHPLRGAYRKLPSAYSPRKKLQEWLVLKKASLRNLKGDDLFLPIKRLTVVCGISGAGKSTLTRELFQTCLRQAVADKKAKLLPQDCQHAGWKEDGFSKFINGNLVDKVIEVDQNPIGKTIRSCPATYIGALDIIREFFASLPESKMQGYTASTYSFNTKGGRCETCKGNGKIKLEMNFLPDTFVDCEDCQGSRYGSELKDIRWNGKNIGEVLAMSFEEAAEFFHFHDRLHQMMNLMVETGLSYIRLGQSSPTLSGGEAQRLKLVSELIKGLPAWQERKRAITTHKLYILEEPTIGLHLRDCERLISILHRLVDQGHTVVVVEHHIDVIKEADYLIEVGPVGGEAGGQILYQGELAGIQNVKESPTRAFLK